MRSRLPFALGLATALCFGLAGSSQTTAQQKKPAVRRKLRKPVNAAIRANSVKQVDDYPTESAEHAIEQPGALVPFFEQLARTYGDATEPVHIIHWGDSHTASDDWTGGLRDLFRERFGDGGSGFSVAGHPFPGYRRFDVHGGGSAFWQTVGGRTGIGDG